MAAGLGYPTANLDIQDNDFLVQPGVYAAYAKLHGREHEAVLVVQDQPRKIEVHLFGYSGTHLYGSTLAVDPLKRVSDIVSFLTREELLAKINNDIRLVREVFLSGNYKLKIIN